MTVYCHQNTSYSIPRYPLIVPPSQVLTGRFGASLMGTLVVNCDNIAWLGFQVSLENLQLDRGMDLQ